jgi:hypothetical protein
MASGKVHCQKNGLTIVALDDLCNVMEACQIEDPIPLHEQVVVVFKQANLSGREFNDRTDLFAQ